MLQNTRVLRFSWVFDKQRLDTVDTARFIGATSTLLNRNTKSQRILFIPGFTPLHLLNDGNNSSTDNFV